MVYDRLGVPISRGSIGICAYTHRLFAVLSVYRSLGSPDHICVEGRYLEGVGCCRRRLLIRTSSGNSVPILEVLRNVELF